MAIALQIERKKALYYSVLHQCSKGKFTLDPSGYDYLPITHFLVKVVEEAASLPRRTIQYALKTLTEKGFLQRLGSGAGIRYQLIF